MSAYNPRRAPNVSQYIANLNTIPSAADLAAQQDFGNFEDDLSMFTNTQFFDFDMNESVPALPADMSSFVPDQTQGQEAKALNFGNQQPFQFPDFSTSVAPYPQPLSAQALPPSPPNGLTSYPPQQQPPQQQSHQHVLHQQLAQLPQQPLNAFTHSSPHTGEKRKATFTSASSPDDFDEGSRGAADEDKRRRNTAASARFRVKKKQREQALEKSAKDMSDKVHILEARVGQLEMENKWLKGLITEKNLKRPDSLTASPKKDLVKPAASLDQSDISEHEDGDRSTEERKDGVGTV